MNYFYQSFAFDLRFLFPTGGTLEVTVPGRITRLLLINYGERPKGHKMITLIDASRTFGELFDLSEKDENFLDSLHPDDRPSFTAITFDCHPEENRMLAEPATIVDFRSGLFETVIYVDEKTATFKKNYVLRFNLTGQASANFERFRRLGFFGPEALKAPRPDLTIDWHQATNTTITSEDYYNDKGEDLRCENFHKVMEFLRRAEEDRERRKKKSFPGQED
ncbi:MAG: hypothetical protein AB7S78_14160 [Candidatus Omnitrophota bacterium]